MRSFFFALVIIFSVSFSGAQVPGYLGKRLTAGYNFHLYPGGFTPNSFTYAKDFDFHRGALFINTFNEAHADYVLSEKYSLGVAYHHFKTAQRYNTSVVISNGEAGTIGAVAYLNIIGNTFLINQRFYFFKNGNAIAPNGRYIQLGIGEISASTTELDRMIKSSYSGYDTLLFVSDNGWTTSSPIFTFSFGSQKIYFEHFFIDSGLEFAFVPGIFRGTIKTKPYEFYGHNYERQKETMNRLQSFYFNTAKIGIGILIF